MNHFVKNTTGGSYIEAVINSWGVSDEQLLNTAAQQLKEKLKGNASIDWPHVEELDMMVCFALFCYI